MTHPAVPVHFHTRAQIGLLPPNLARLSPRNAGTLALAGVTIHHTATGGIHSAADAQNAWREIQRSAMNGTLPSGDRYGDHPYACGFDDWANIYEGREQRRYVGAHATSTRNIANQQTFGVAYIGAGNPTPAALYALQVVVFLASLQCHVAHLEIMDHREWQPFGGIGTECPGDALHAETAAIRKSLHL